MENARINKLSFVQHSNIASVMASKVAIAFSFLGLSLASLHLDKVMLTGNELYNDMNYSYYHDQKLNAHVDFAIQTKAVANKILIYLKATIADNGITNNREYFRTVIDFDKLINGLYGNPMISGFTKTFVNDLHALNLKTPLPAVSVQIKKWS